MTGSALTKKRTRALRYTDTPAQADWCLRINLITLLVFALAGALAFVWLSSKRTEMSRELQHLRHEYALKSKARENLKNELESHTDWDNIKDAVAALGLDLNDKNGRVCRVDTRQMRHTPQRTSREEMLASRE